MSWSKICTSSSNKCQRLGENNSAGTPWRTCLWRRCLCILCKLLKCLPKMCLRPVKRDGCTKQPGVIGRHTSIRQSQRLKFTFWKCNRSASVKRNQLTWQFQHDRYSCMRKKRMTLLRLHQFFPLTLAGGIFFLTWLLQRWFIAFEGSVRSFDPTKITDKCKSWKAMQSAFFSQWKRSKQASFLFCPHF